MQLQIDASHADAPRAAALANSPLLAAAGAAAFGVALAFSIPDPGRLSPVLAWAVALALLPAVTWLICLPALYIPWAAREPRLTVAGLGGAAFAAVAIFGTCLGATAPIQWFFATTAPESQWLSSLAFIFTWLALIASHVTFRRAIQASGIRMATWAWLLFFALQATAFFQFVEMVGLQYWLG